jgi:hypothetical protein
MKSFDVILEARVIIMAKSEYDAIDIASKLVWEKPQLLIPTTVREGYPNAWEPKKEVTPIDGLPANKATFDVTKAQDLTKAHLQKYEAEIDNEVPF